MSNKHNRFVKRAQLEQSYGSYRCEHCGVLLPTSYLSVIENHKKLCTAPSKQVKASLQASDVEEGDFFILSSQKGYGAIQRKEAMQVMECWPTIMTVKCLGGCMDKPYDHFEKVTDLTAYTEVHKSEYFEDNRRKEPSNV